MSRLFESVDFRNCPCNWTQSGWWSEEYRPTINPHIPTILGAYFRRAGAYLTVRKLTTIATCCLFHWSGQIWLYPARIPACLWQLLTAAHSIFLALEWEVPVIPGKQYWQLENCFLWEVMGRLEMVTGCDCVKNCFTLLPTSRSVDLCVLKVAVFPSSPSWELSNY